MNVKTAIIGRTGFHRQFIEKGAEELTTLIPDTPFGEPCPVHILSYKEKKFAVLSRHGEDGKYRVSAPFVNNRANLWTLKMAGVSKIISWSAPGSINDMIKPGDIVIPDDVLDETKDGPYTFYEGKGLGFIRQNPVFCPSLRETFGKFFSLGDFRFHTSGVYTATQGPRLETPAEIRKYRSFGGDLVGMTVVPEVFLAKELEMCYGAICYSVNYAEGIKERPLKRDELFEGLLTLEEKKDVDRIEASIVGLTLDLLFSIDDFSRNCSCSDSMLRYKERGDISENWQDWII